MSIPVNYEYSFEKSYQQWTRIPIDDLGYFTADELLQLTQDQMAELVDLAGSIRFSPHQWRNLNGSLLAFMGLAALHGKVVMDYGCGLGLDSVQFAAAGAAVILADIHPKNLWMGQQVMASSTSRIPVHLCISMGYEPWLILPDDMKLDMFWSWGVLHHTPNMVKILERVCSLLNEDGVIKIGLYSDKRWEELTGTPLPPIDMPIPQHPSFRDFVKKCDSVGLYADWYNQEKLEREVKGFAKVVSADYIGNGHMLGAVLQPK